MFDGVWLLHLVVDRKGCFWVGWVGLGEVGFLNALLVLFCAFANVSE